MKLSEFLDKVDLSKLRETLESEFGLIVEFETSSICDSNVLLRVTLSHRLSEMRFKKTAEFKIFLKSDMQFKYLDVFLPVNLTMCETDLFKNISRIVADHVRSELNS